MPEAQQINPPFDGGQPCPMCSQGVRNAAALVHNFLVRWPEPRALHKLCDLASDDPAKIETNHPAIRRLLDAAQRLVDEYRTFQAATAGKGGTREDVDGIGAVVPELRAAAIEAERLSDDHFHDHRHSHGEANILRERQGYSSSLDGTGKHYHDTVEIVDAGGDITHQICGTQLKLGPSFKDELARDPTFYDTAWCPKCRANAPFSQFLRAVT